MVKKQNPFFKKVVKKENSSPKKFVKKQNQKNIIHKVVEIRRVCKVGKGGKTLSFRALVVAGNQKGIVGIGIGKANEVLTAIKKGQYKAIQTRFQIALTATKTIPHKTEARFGAAQVILRPTAQGSGVIAGGAGRAVLEVAGIKNILAKQLKSKNKINNARATLMALASLRFLTTTAKLRGLNLESLTGRKTKIHVAPAQETIETKQKTPSSSLSQKISKREKKAKG